MDEKIKRLLNWAKGIPQPPSTIELIPTNRCNFNCRSCWRQGIPKEEMLNKYKEEMSDERLLRLIDEAYELGVLEFAFVGGGEPLSRPITFELMKKIREYGMRGDIVTNGSLLSNEVIETLVDIEWTRIKVSIDGSTANLQNELRGVKCYDKIFMNLKYLSDLKKKKNKEHPKLGFNTVVSNKNYKDLPNIIKLAGKLGANEILILPLTVFSEEGKKLKLNQEQMAEFQGIIKKCLPLLKNYNIYSNLEKFLDLRYLDKTNNMHEVLMEEAEKRVIKEKIEKGANLISKKSSQALPNFITMPCFEPWKHITIIANGNIASCFNDYVWTTKVSIKDHSLKELWHGPYFEGYRKQILTRKLPKACATCCVWRVFEAEEIKNTMETYLSKGLFR
jgi:MoaA/NifB/PqqE/SkfB family radical SAM enzyme